MKRYMQSAAILSMMVGLSGGLTGCSMLTKMFKKKPSRYQQRKAAQAKKQAEAQKVYDELVKSDSCDNIKERAKKASQVKGSMMDKYPEIGYRAAKCGYWDFVFVKSAMAHPKTTSVIMSKLEAKGIDVYSAFGKWLAKQQKPFSMAYGGHALINLTPWFTEKHGGKTTHCSTVYAASKRASGKFEYRGYGRRASSPYARGQLLNKLVQRQLIYFLFKAGCRSKLPSYLTSQLESLNWRDRNQACIILGRMKVRSAARKVRILSSTDGYYFTRRYRRVYPVRNNCRAAYGRILM